VRRRLGAWVGASLLATMAALTLGACAGVEPSATAPASPSATAPASPATGPPADGLQVVVASSSLWVGPGTVLAALQDAQNQPIALDGLTVTARLQPGGREVAGRVVRPLAEGRRLVRFDADFDAPGRWTLEVTTTAADGETREASAAFEVRDPGDVPGPGEAAPATRTPTAFDVASMLARLTSDPIPERSYYWLSPAEAIEAGQPFALILDSFGFRETQACGGALGIMHHLAPRFPSVSVIHVEPYATRWNGRTLELDPPAGPAQLASWSEAWGLGDDRFGAQSVPWVFVVGADGVVHAVFQGIMGTDELATALGDVSPWTPTGGAPVTPTAAP
jgi:hypothetical protein